MNDHLKETITKWLAIPVVVLPIIFSIIIAAEDDETPAPTSLYNGDDYTHEEEFVTDAGEVLGSGYNYDEEQDEDTFTTVIHEVFSEALGTNPDADADDYE